MGHIEGKNRNQTRFLSLDDYIDKESMARVIDRFIDISDLNELGFKNATANELGRNSYNPNHMAKLYVYGYEHSIRSSRKLEEASKLDLNPPPWLPPVKRGWVPMPIHAQYGTQTLPMLNVVRLEENIAEKIARLNRTTTARDLYDLRWIMTNQRIVGDLDTDLIRRLAVLKIWVDANGIRAGNTYWKPGHEGPAFIPDLWLRDRSKGEFDLEDIGALTTPPPTAKELSDAVCGLFGFLSHLDEDEKIVASVREQDRPLVLAMLMELPGNRLNGIGLY